MAQHDGLSVRTVTILMMAVVALFGWAFAATGYADSIAPFHAAHGPDLDGLPVTTSVQGLTMMAYSFCVLCKNALVQIPSLFSVVAFTFRERIGIPITVGVLEALVVGAGVKLAAMERDLNRPRGRR